MNEILPDQVVVISDFSKIQGGAAKLALLQADLLAARGIPVTYFCGDDGTTLSANMSAVALNGIPLLKSGKPTAALNGLWDRRVKGALAQWMDEHDTPNTIYHVHGYHQILSPAVLAPLRTVGDRVALHAHDYFLACPNGAFFDYRSATTCTRRPMSLACAVRNCDKRSYAQKLWRLSRQSLQDNARKKLGPKATIILIHDKMRGYLFRDGLNGQISVLPNPAESLLSTPVKAQENRDIVFVGDIHHYKGVELLASAGRQAKLKIRFVGTGQDYEALKKSYPEHQFDGWQDREGLRTIMAKTRLLVSPTLGPEPFGLAVAEALLSGIPVLLSDSMLLSSEIVTADMGRDFAACDQQALAEKLEILAQDDVLVAQLSANARKNSHKLSLGTEDWAEGLLAIYQDILKRK